MGRLYGVGSTRSCKSAGYEDVTGGLDACLEASRAVGVLAAGKWIGSLDEIPAYCSVQNTGIVTYNTRASGKGRSNQAPICKVTEPVLKFSKWYGALSARFRRLPWGHNGCQQAGLKDIKSQEACAEASLAIGVIAPRDWIGSRGDIPAYCSVQDTGIVTYNTRASGKGRSNQAPICAE